MGSETEPSADSLRRPRVYTDQSIFEEEREKIFEKVWTIVCHESEVPNAYDFRRCQHMNGKELLVVRGKDMKVRVFYNQCPHRGNVLAFEPSGNARRITCIFHLWSFDTQGNCVEITREKEGFQDRLSRKDVGLREVKSEMDMGGFVWVNVDDDCEPLDEFLGDSVEFLRGELTTAPLEIMCYHKAIVPTNYKLWHDTNRDLYHEFLHRQNRLIAMGQPGYLDRRYHMHVHGHVTADPLGQQLQEHREGQRRQEADGLAGRRGRAAQALQSLPYGDLQHAAAGVAHRHHGAARAGGDDRRISGLRHQGRFA